MQAPSTVNNCARADKGAIRRWYEDAQWLDYGFSVSREAANKFSVSSATSTAVAWYEVGRRVRFTENSSGVVGYGAVTEASVSGTTTNITCSFDSSASLTSSLSSVDVGILTSVSGATIGQSIVQTVITSSTTGGGSTTVIPLDNTIPQNTEGSQFYSLAITPTISTNILEIEVFSPIITLASPGSYSFIGALFQDSTANALTSTFGGTNGQMFLLRYRMVAGTTSETTFRFRYGPSSAGTAYFNRGAASDLFGGACYSFMKIHEILS